MATFQDNRRRHNWKRFNNQMNSAYQFRRSSPYYDPYSQNPLVFCVILDTSMNITTHKSASQKRRDEQRRELFNSRKSMCVSMPFYDLTDDDLAKCMPKHLHTDRPNFDHSSAEIYSLKEEVELLKSSVTSLQTSLTEERERRLIAEEQVVQSTKRNSQLQKDLQSETSVRISQVSKLRDLNSVNLTLTQQFKAKTLECDELQIKLEGERSSNSLLKQETVQLSNQIEQLNKQLEHCKRQEAHCTKCGESDCFHPSKQLSCSL